MSGREPDVPAHITIYPARWKLAMNAVGSLVFILAGVAFAATPTLETRLIGGGAILFFAVTGLYAVRRLIVRTPALVIAPEGLWDNASMFGVGWIAWPEIEKVERRRKFVVRAIAIFLRDPDAVFTRVPGWRRWLVRLDAIVEYAPVNIPADNLEMRFDAVDELIHDHLARHGGGLADFTGADAKAR
jgi:hypothetical protein